MLHHYHVFERDGIKNLLLTKVKLWLWRNQVNTDIHRSCFQRLQQGSGSPIRWGCFLLARLFWCQTIFSQFSTWDVRGSWEISDCHLAKIKNKFNKSITFVYEKPKQEALYGRSSLRMKRSKATSMLFLLRSIILHQILLTLFLVVTRLPKLIFRCEFIPLILVNVRQTTHRLLSL